ncbi:hypothetical protein DL95DRAFT_494056 [Leptodontidium sp. 2 PMI_412]|nr:hypothetical protein DL95DRAFT_494056 [Leptodontidium sp. 2 PMI_412]
MNNPLPNDFANLPDLVGAGRLCARFGFHLRSWFGCRSTSGSAVEVVFGRDILSPLVPAVPLVKEQQPRPDEVAITRFCFGDGKRARQRVKEESSGGWMTGSKFGTFCQAIFERLNISAMAIPLAKDGSPKVEYRDTCAVSSVIEWTIGCVIYMVGELSLSFTQIPTWNVLQAAANRIQGTEVEAEVRRLTADIGIAQTQRRNIISEEYRADYFRREVPRRYRLRVALPHPPLVKEESPDLEPFLPVQAPGTKALEDELDGGWVGLIRRLELDSSGESKRKWISIEGFVSEESRVGQKRSL